MLLILTLLAAIFFGSIAVFLSIKEEKTKKSLLEKEKIHKQRLYEISILKEIQDRIGYSLDTEKVIDVITGSLRNLFSYSSTASIVIKENSLIFKIYLEEPVSHLYVSQVQKSMLASVKALLPNAPQNVDERIAGVALDDANTLPLSSFFHIPLVVNNKVVGLINVSSVKPNLYKEDEMTMLYQITQTASNALSRLEQVLTSEKGKLASMIGSLADGVFMVDTNNNLLIINEAAKKLMRIEKDNPTLFDIVASIPAEFDLFGRINQAIEEFKTIEVKELQIGERTVQVFITPVSQLEEQNKVRRVSILLHDITAEKNLATLKEDFTNMMVHELRAPLTAIKDSSDLIMGNIESLKKEEEKQFLEIINQQSKIVLDQIRSILDAAKLEAGKFTLQKTEGTIGETIKEVGRIFTSLADKKHILISYEIPNHLPLVSFDRTRITQVLNNLLSNSLKFTPEGGNISIKIHNNISKDNKFLTISVIDTGIGIPKEQQKDLFSKFTQASNNPQHKALEGTGLGLYVVKGIVEAHGGNVEVESNPNEGTTISFTLPISDEQFEKYVASTTSPRSPTFDRIIN